MYIITAIMSSVWSTTSTPVKRHPGICVNEIPSLPMKTNSTKPTIVVDGNRNACICLKTFDYNGPRLDHQ